jgi:hypothetical protein
MQSEHDGRNDFDFFIGRWKGHNRRLRERLKGSTEWEEFEGTVIDRKILGGMGNIDEVAFHRETGKVEDHHRPLIRKHRSGVYGASTRAACWMR